MGGRFEQTAVAIVGGIAGFLIGGPSGAALGFQLGLLAGSALFPTQLPGVTGPRLEDLNTTTAQVGGPVPIIFGTIAVPGTVIWLGELKEVSTTEEVGGKGGPEQSVTTYTYFQSIAIGLCEGPIGGILRIWENGKVVYDIRAQQEGESDQDYQNRLTASAAYEEGFTLYFGDEDQEPDPTIEMDQGVGNVPAFRGLAYIVFHNRQLKDDQARRHPSFKFEVLDEGALDCQEVTEYSNEVLYPWVENAETNTDPRNCLNDHQYKFIGESTGVDQVNPPFRTSLSAALDDAKSILADPLLGSHLIGWSIGSNSSAYSAALRPTAGGSPGERVTLNMHIQTVTEADGTFLGYFPTLDDVGFPEDCEAVLFGGCTVGGPEFLWWGNRFSGESLDNVRDIGMYYMMVGGDPQRFPRERNNNNCNFGAVLRTVPDLIVRLERVPRKPDPPCTPRCGDAPKPELDGNYCKIDGFLVENTEWELDQSTTYRVLARYTELTPGGQATIVNRYPLNPCRPQGHPEYNSQAFWEAAYAAAVASGDMPAGLTYGVHYPVTQNFGYVRTYTRCIAHPRSVNLALIIERICARVGLDDIDVSDLTSITVDGYAITRPMPARQAIDPLRSVGFFDVVERGHTLRFAARGKATVTTLAESDLGAHEPGESAPPAITTRKIQDLELPRQVRVHYLASSREYEPGEQLSPTRLTTDAVNDVDIELPIALPDTQAAQIAEVLWADAWRSRWVHQFALDQRFAALEPADCIGVPVDGRIQRVRIVSIDDSGEILRRIEACRDDDGSYVSFAVAAEPERRPNTIDVLAGTELILLDLPALRDEDDDAGVYAACIRSGVGTTWNGAVIFRSIDDGATYNPIASVTQEATVGELVSALADGITSTFDEAAELIVDLETGTLESRTESAVLNGANTAAIGNHGRWQLVQFRDAEEISAGRWRLTGILRGRRGTEYLAANSMAGDRFVLVSGPGIIRLPLQNAEIGAERIYRAVSIGAAFTTGVNQAFTGAGMALECFSPVQVTGTRNEDGDLIISWMRRDRLSQTLRSNIPLPMSEASESYEIDIIAPGSPDEVLRTLTSSSESVTYTAVQQAEDFGSPIPQQVIVRVYQLSALVGRGIPAEAIV